MKTKVEINIKEIIQKDMAISTDDGLIIFNKVSEELEKGNDLIIDFYGIEVIITAFLNVAIGKLYGNNLYNSDFLNEHVKIVNVNSEDVNLFKMVIARAKEYFNTQDKIDNSAETVFGDD